MTAPSTVTNRVTDQQEAFCQHFAVNRSVTEAYRHAYNAANMAPTTVNNEASKLAKRPHVAARINELMERHARQVFATNAMTVERLFQIEAEIATADPNDVCEWKVSPCRRCWGDGHKFQWIELEYLEALEAWERLTPAQQKLSPMPDCQGGFGYDRRAAPNFDCPFCIGEGEGRMVIKPSASLPPGARRLYAGVKSSRQGLEVLMQSQDKARENIGRMLGAYKDSLRVDARVGLIAAIASLPADPQDAERFYREQLG